MVVWWILLALVVAGALCVAYGVLIERRWYRTVRYRLDILPTGTARTPKAGTSAPLTVLHLSDLHFARGDRRMTAYLARLPQPDVTVVTGDLVGEPEAVEAVVGALRPVRGRVASYFVLGSNDHFVTPRWVSLNWLKYFSKTRTLRVARRGRAPELIAALEADGWTSLRNERIVTDLAGIPAEVVGLDDPHIAWHDLRVAPRRAADRFGLAIVHSPDAAPELAALGYDLILSGHTHGGQVRLPLVGALVTNSVMPTRLVSGLIRFGPSYLYTSPGIGTNRFAPFRFLCRPEVAYLDLQPSAGRTSGERSQAVTRS
ncbi:MAG: metallophosphoesterase [Actinomycetota bacterium]